MGSCVLSHPALSKYNAHQKLFNQILQVIFLLGFEISDEVFGLRDWFFIDFCFIANFQFVDCWSALKIHWWILAYILSVDIRTFEVLLRTYEVREGKMDCIQGNEGGPLGPRPGKRRQRLGEASNEHEISTSTRVMARPAAEARGHTGYLTFARLRCLS